MKILAGLWNGPTMVGAFYTKYLKRVADVVTIGPEVGQSSDIPVDVREPISPHLTGNQGPFDVYIQFYSKPDYFPPDLYKVDIPKVWVVYDLHLHAYELGRTAFLFDLIIVTDEASRQVLLKMGIPRVRILPFAVDHEIFYRPWEERSRLFKVGFSGSVSGHPQLEGRRRLLERVESSFPLQVENRSKTGSDVADFYQDCHVVINQAVHHDLNMRVMEVLIAGRPLITPNVPGLKDILEESTHAVIYDDDSIIEKLQWMIDHPEECEAMAQRGQEHAMAHHTYEVRAREMLNILEEEKSYWENPTIRKHPDHLRTTQFLYHWFRFPGDALDWLAKHWAYHNFPGKMMQAFLRIASMTLRAVGILWNRKYFQSKDD